MPQISTKYLSRTTACAVALVALLFVYPARVAAIPISEYQQHLKDAIASLETLIEFVKMKTKTKSTTDYETHLNETLAGIRATLPRNQTVESEGEVYNVDNAWLHKAIDELRQEVFPIRTDRTDHRESQGDGKPRGRTSERNQNPRE